MTIQKLLNALPEVQKLVSLKLPIKKAYQVYILAKLINDKRDFFINEEKKLIEKYQAKIENNGAVSFSNIENQKAFNQEHSELFQYEIDDINVVDLTFDDLKDMEFTPVEIAMLDGVINFTD